MTNSTAPEWNELSQAFAFVGNSLLKSINLTPKIGLEPAFWDAFPQFGNKKIKAGVEKLRAYTQSLEELDEQDRVETCAVELTDLFVLGGTEKFVSPWETLYRNEGSKFGYGEATVEMRRLLASKGLRVSSDNRQYDDHIGIELMYLAACCKQIDQGETCEATALGEMAHFIEEHPQTWIAKLQRNVRRTYPDCYVDGLLDVAQGLMEIVLDARHAIAA